MPEISVVTWIVGIAALVIGILAGHFGWGRRWRLPSARVHPDYLTGLDYLVTEQPDRALDVFLKLMETSADTVETHFALGSLYRRRGEVERAIRIHESLLARTGLPAEHREQALLAMAQDYLRAGLLDRAERLLLEVCRVPRLRVTALDALRGVYERQHEWRQALDTHRELARAGAAPPAAIAAHYLCELAAAAAAAGDLVEARRLLREARAQQAGFPRAALLRARVAEREADQELAVRLLHEAVRRAPVLLGEELPRLAALAGLEARDGLLSRLVGECERDPAAQRQLVFAALAAGIAAATPLAGAVASVFAREAALSAALAAGGGDLGRATRELGALLAHAERYRCAQCGFTARSFYWQCPACHAWEAFEPHAVVTLR